MSSSGDGIFQRLQSMLDESGTSSRAPPTSSFSDGDTLMYQAPPTTAEFAAAPLTDDDLYFPDASGVKGTKGGKRKAWSTSSFILGVVAGWSITFLVLYVRRCRKRKAAVAAAKKSKGQSYIMPPPVAPIGTGVTYFRADADQQVTGRPAMHVEDDIDFVPEV